ncbi:50S ribosomal protein L18 [Patescibacteria group bacterium]|nr:50S ribosomal protein L18 [Patescibacteria group bacterium]
MVKITAKERRKARHRRIRTRIQGTKERPRLVVSRSNQHLYAQLVDDETGNVLAAVSDLKAKGKMSGVKLAKSVGKAIAKKAQGQGVSKAVFDRGGYKYHGSVKALAEGAREGGLQF